MDSEILAALIGGLAVITAAIIGLIGMLILHRRSAGEVMSSYVEVHEKARSTSGFRRRLHRHWPVFLILIAALNYYWEFLGSGLGPEVKSVLLFLSLLYGLLHYLMLILNHSMGDTSKRKLLIRNLSMTIAILAMPFLFKTAVAAYYSLDGQGRFAYRVADMLEHQHRMFNSPYMPESVYSFFKKLLHLPYNPALLDTVRIYDSVDIVAYHIGNTGIIAYEFQGQSRGGEPTVCYFTHYGETEDVKSGKNVEFRSLPDNLRIDPDFVYPVPGFRRGSAVFGSIELPAEFHFVRWFCAPKSMSSRLEGIVIDLGCIENLPSTVTFTFVTDQRICNENIYRVEREHTLIDWLLARPTFAFDDEDFVRNIRPTCETGIIEQMAEDLTQSGHAFNRDDLLVYECTLQVSHSREIFLLCYKVIQQDGETA